MPEKIPVLLDTDIGSDIDDAVCLAYLLAEPRCELVGVTTVTGHAQERARLADAICRAAGRDDIPIASGTETPLLVRQGQTEAPQAEVLCRWPHTEQFARFEAVQFLRDTIRSRPGEITLLAIGPLSNVGLLFAVDREIPGMLKALVMMVGCFFEDGCAEWNARCDPHATAIVFSSAVCQVRAHGLDVTTRCRLSAQECRARFKGGALDVVANMAEVFFRQRQEIVFHDPLAAVCVFEPEICAYERGRVRVELRGEADVGRTVLERYDDGPHQVARKVDSERFFRRYFSAVSAWTG